MNVFVEPAPNSIVVVGNTQFGNKLPLSLIAGPCALESRDHAFEMASALKDIADRLGIGFVYKTSFDKANRTSRKSKRGIGLDRALPIFAEIRGQLGIPLLTDVHEIAQCKVVSQVADVLQFPLSSVGEPIAHGSRADRPRDQCEKGTVFGPLGYGKCRRKNHRGWESSTCW